MRSYSLNLSVKGIIIAFGFFFVIALFTINRLYISRCCFYININKLTFVSNQLFSFQRTTI